MIPFMDLTAQYHHLRPEMEAAIQRVLQGGRFILGQEVAAFEEEFAAFCGVPFAVAVASGSEALQLALLACGISPGDEVITSPLTAVATVAAIEMAGARPILVDIDPQRYTLHPAQVEAALTSRTRVILPVHLYGCPADLSPLLEIARLHGLTLIEDCAQAHGASYHSKMVGAWGELGAFSFYPTKNLGAYGDAGAILTSRADLAEKLRKIRQYGWGAQQISEQKGINSRLDEIQAAILRVKLPHLAAWNARRRELASLYHSRLARTRLVLPPIPQDSDPVFHLYVIRHPQRDALQAYLAGRGMQTLVHYPVPIHLQPAYADLGYRRGSLPEAETASREVLSLPLYPELSAETVEEICRAILDFDAQAR